MEALPESKHFHLEPLTDGVYAALAKTGGGAVANAGIVDLGDRALIFDTFVTPQAARDLVAAAQKITGHPLAYAVNSHWHSDHVIGNQAMPADTVIISTHLTRTLIAERIPKAIIDRQQDVPHQLSDLEARFQTKLDTQERQAVGGAIDFFRMVLEDLPTMEIRLPTLTFERKLSLHGPARQVELITFGGGHTVSDTILYLPDDQIAFVADLLFNEQHPWIGDGNPTEWLRILDEIDALDPEIDVVVPGHGAIATPAAFGLMRRYIPALRNLVAGVIVNGGTADDVLQQPIPAAFVGWGGADRFAGNIRFLYGQQQSAS